MLSPPPYVCRGRVLAPLTTLKLGGPAEYFVDAKDESILIDALTWAHNAHVPVRILGGGSNVVIADEGVDGLVIHISTRGRSQSITASGLCITVKAGEDWDQLVRDTTDLGYAGLECLSGIPGLVGASPVQNIGAYGQEVSQVLEGVHVLERSSLTRHYLTPAECAFGYRTSCFKKNPEAFVVLAVDFLLPKRQTVSVNYKELSSVLGDVSQAPLQDVRQKVLELRRKKSMLIEPGTDSFYSAGSFFLNPILTSTEFEALSSCVTVPVPSFFFDDQHVKVPAAWLIEQAGFSKGQRIDHVGISSKHALALVHHGGGTTKELLTFAQEIQLKIKQCFGIRLVMEPVAWGKLQASL